MTGDVVALRERSAPERRAPTPNPNAERRVIRFPLRTYTSAPNMCTYTRTVPRARANKGDGVSRGFAIVVSVMLAFGGLLVSGTERQIAAASTATTTDALNLRASPVLGSHIRRVIPAGARVTVSGGPDNGFYSVRYDGTSGWASGQYLRFRSSVVGSIARTTDALNLRSGPSTSNSVVLVMPAGSDVKIRGTRRGFYAITYRGVRGWASSGYLTVLSGQASGGGSPSGSFPQGVYIVTDNLNLRTSPSTSSSVITVLPRGTSVETTGDAQNGFARIRYGGRTGWVSRIYLDTGGPAPVAREPSNTGFVAKAAGSGIAIVVEDLNFRASPSRSGRIITVLPAGTEVRLSGSASNGFYRVFVGKRMGWVSAEYLLPPAKPVDRYGYSRSLIRKFIVDAARRYGQNPEAMLRVAQCESNLIPTAVNRSGSYGLFQFVPSTWASTPFADQDVFEAWANANAAAWMWSVGRRNEWVCQ